MEDKIIKIKVPKDSQITYREENLIEGIGWGSVTFPLLYKGNIDQLKVEEDFIEVGVRLGALVVTKENDLYIVDKI